MEKKLQLIQRKDIMKENSCTAISEAAAIIRAVLIRILAGKIEVSAKQCRSSLDIAGMHA